VGSWGCVVGAKRLDLELGVLVAKESQLIHGLAMALAVEVATKGNLAGFDAELCSTLHKRAT
jgi:hypothetical protein